MRKSECVKGSFYAAFGIGVLISCWLSTKLLVVVLALTLVFMGFTLLTKRK